MTKRKRNDINADEGKSHAPSFAVQSAVLMIQQHAETLGRQSEEMSNNKMKASNKETKKRTKQKRSDINANEGKNHTPSLAVQSAVLMMQQHTEMLGRQSEEIQRILTNPIKCQKLASERPVANPHFELKDDDPLHEIMHLSRQLKKMKRDIRFKRKELEAAQACDEHEEALFSFNYKDSERFREWDSSL